MSTLSIVCYVNILWLLIFCSVTIFLELKDSFSESKTRVGELEQEVEVLEGELSAAQDAAKKAPSRTLRALVERLRNQLAIKEKQQRVNLECLS